MSKTVGDRTANQVRPHSHHWLYRAKVGKLINHTDKFWYIKLTILGIAHLLERLRAAPVLTGWKDSMTTRKGAL